MSTFFTCVVFAFVWKFVQYTGKDYVAHCLFRCFTFLTFFFAFLEASHEVEEETPQLKTNTRHATNVWQGFRVSLGISPIQCATQ